jgi:hypothetical protein
MAGTASSRAHRLSPARLALHAEALASVVAASLAIRLLPFRRVVEARPPGRARGEVDIALLRAAVRAWARRVPWRAKCFESGVALRAMLARRGIPSTLHYGIGSGEDLIAHVWLSVDGETVIGGEEAAKFAQVAEFAPRGGR